VTSLIIQGVAFMYSDIDSLHVFLFEDNTQPHVSAIAQI